MYIASSTEYQNHPVIVKMIEDFVGGGTIARTDLKSTDELKAGAVVGVDTNGLFHVLKTAKIVAGGSSSAPRIAKEHELVVDNVISDGAVSLTIASITVGVSYDTLAFDSGVLVHYAADQILYAVETEDVAGHGTAATAAVTGDTTDVLTVTVPVKANPAGFNGITVEIKQDAGDNLEVSYASGVLLIKLAKTTASKNNAAAIQAAIRALGVAEGIDWQFVTATGGAGWDGGQTGAVLTVPLCGITGGVNYATQPFKYTPVGVTLNSLDLSVPNNASGIMVRGTVDESLMPQYVSTGIKAALNLIRFV